MNKLLTGLIAGLAFGIIDILLMMPLDMPNKNIAMAGAFFNRFAIGFLIPNTNLPFPMWLSGLLIGLLLSLPDAIITGAYIPILSVGIVGGGIIGSVLNKYSRIE
ncbi:MAG: hypothetical protein D8M58_21615 [Calditrichaeota bacterium]|nr:MAG: hypothetical protein DWQ03_17080 [Calditrichota bacterium]MBL1208013.1 hypothetical protein [Calditrichota bacterium]NOG47849.1 hypothetical protein [Calditrichota bacterium]